MFELRQRAARNAGFANFRDYIFPAKFRFDYTPADCERFHEAIEATVAPAVERLLGVRRSRLGLDRLRPWDLAVDPYRQAPLRPFSTTEEFVGRARSVFQRVDAALGAEFQIMIEERLLDLDSRKGKAPGGYCETLHHRGRPFIFMNAVGVVDDVMTLLHEAGHAFHAFASHEQPLIWQRHPGSEAAELASMSMELLAGRAPGAAGRLLHRRTTIAAPGSSTSKTSCSAWCTSRRSMRSRPGSTPAATEATPRRATPPGSGSASGSSEGSIGPASTGSGWHDGTASCTSFSTRSTTSSTASRRSARSRCGATACRDQAGAVASYRRALALGAVRGLPDIYRAAGAELTFDAAKIGELVKLVENEIERVRGELPG